LQTWSREGGTGSKESAITSVVETSASKEPFDDSASLCKATIEESGLIDDLCTFIKNLGETSPVMSPATCLGLVRLEEKKYAEKVTPGANDAPQESHSQDGGGVVCLDDYLAPNHSWELTRQKRMALALSLSLTILQFYPTPWISTVWTWKDFSMVRGERSKIFVTKKFFSASHNAEEGASQPLPYETSPFWACFGEPVLTRLGCRLVELAIGKRLSDYRQPQKLDTAEDPDMLDLWTAQKVVESGLVFQEAGECYNNAVQACLTHQVMLPEGVKGLNSKHDNFQLDLEQFVVAPIRDFYAASWGQIP
jgi:hypothetical protein